MMAGITQKGKKTKFLWWYLRNLIKETFTVEKC